MSVYCCPLAPFGPPPTYTGPTMNEDGAEHLYSPDINEPLVNFGVSILEQTPGALKLWLSGAMQQPAVKAALDDCTGGPPPNGQ